jgi:hypothetical protein
MSDKDKPKPDAQLSREQMAGLLSIGVIDASDEKQILAAFDAQRAQIEYWAKQAELWAKDYKKTTEERDFQYQLKKKWHGHYEKLRADNDALHEAGEAVLKNYNAPHAIELRYRADCMDKLRAVLTRVGARTTNPEEPK